MKKPNIAGKISKDPNLLAKIKRQIGTNSCNLETPVDSFPIFPILLASKRKQKIPAIAPIKTLNPKEKPIIIPDIVAIKMATKKVIPKIVICNLVQSSVFENNIWDYFYCFYFFSINNWNFSRIYLWFQYFNRCNCRYFLPTFTC